MSIEYDYEIIKTDPNARVMEIRYTAEGRNPVHMSARLPFVGEDFEAVVRQYAPVAYWLEQEAQVYVPPLARGRVVPHVPVAVSNVPNEVTRAQGKAVLVSTGLWEQVEAIVAAIPNPQERALANLALNDTQFWQRGSPFLNTAAAALGLTAEQMDNLFIEASKIVL